MKTIILLLLLKLLCVQYIFCDENILSKFHQNNYKVRDVRMQLMSYSEKYYKHFEIKTFKYNRTTPAVNGTLNMKIAVKDKVEIVVQLYKFLSNEYRDFPVRFQVNLKKVFDANAGGIKAIRKCGNVTSVYFDKDVTYHACNFVVDETHFPPLIPNGRYKVEVTVLYLDEEIACVHGFGEIYIPIAYPKN